MEKEIKWECYEDAKRRIGKNRFWNILKKVLLYTLAAIAVGLVLVVLYKILEFLFVAAILLIAWIGVGPRR